MQLHTFKARTLPEALRLVRKELGPDASVLHTREVTSGLSRWLGGRTIEVTASREMVAPSRLPVLVEAGGGQARDNEVPPAELQDFRGRIRAGLAVAAGAEPSLVEQLAGGSMRRVVGHLPRNGSLRQRLRSNGVSDRTADRWLERLEAELACDPESHLGRTQERLRHIIAADSPVRGPIRLRDGQPTVITLVGPTGVGKTTTLAKLAAHFHLRERRSVGLITVDTFRIAAIEQLRAYAQIMELPLEVAATAEAMPAAIARLAGCEVVLIDTPGRSPRDEAAMCELHTILGAVRPDEVPLVLSGAGAEDSLGATAQPFVRAGATSLILTKLDEAWRIGQLPDWLAACGLGLSYTTHGQNVPDDIEVASAARLAEWIFPHT